MAISVKRIGLAIVLVAMAVLFVAWLDGGEEPLRPISETVPVPESLT